MNAILTIAFKDLKLLFRDRVALFWIFAFPVAFAVFFGVVFGSDNRGRAAGISLAIVDEDQSNASNMLIRRLAVHDSLRFADPARQGSSETSLPPDTVGTVTWAEAKDAVKKGRTAALLRIPAGYGDNPYALFGGDAPALTIGIDPGRRAEAGMLQGIVMESVFGALQDRFGDRDRVQQDIAGAIEGLSSADDLSTTQRFAARALLGAVSTFVDQVDMRDFGSQPASSSSPNEATSAPSTRGPAIDILDVTRDRRNRPRSPYDVTFPQAVVWGLMSVAMTFAILLVRERTAGTLVRLRMAPLSRTHLLCGKALGCFLGSLLTTIVLLVFSSLALGVRFDNLLLLTLAVLSTAVCFTGLTMTVSALGRTESAVSGSAWGLMMPFAMLGGGMIPLVAMPKWLQSASHLSPFKWAIVGLEGATWRGFTLGDMGLPCLILVSTGVAAFVLGIALFRRVDGSAPA